jgi:hypothetical protein
MNIASYYIRKEFHLCPQCGGSAIRIKRRMRDRLISLFHEVHRFRCEQLGCCWEGNLRVEMTPRLPEPNVARLGYIDRART